MIPLAILVTVVCVYLTSGGNVAFWYVMGVVGGIALAGWANKQQARQKSERERLP